MAYEVFMGWKNKNAIANIKKDFRALINVRLLAFQIKIAAPVELKSGNPFLI